MEITTEITDSFFTANHEIHDFNGYKVMGSSHSSILTVNNNLTPLTYDKNLDYLFVLNRKIPKKHKEIYSKIIQKASNVFYAPSDDAEPYFRNFANFVLNCIDERSKINDKISESEENPSLKVIEDKLKKELELSKKISKEYNKIIIPVLGSNIISENPTEYQFNVENICPFLINDNIYNIKVEYAKYIIEQEEEEDDEETSEEREEENAEKILQEVNNDSRLRQLKYLFKISDEQIKEQLT